MSEPQGPQDADIHHAAAAVGTYYSHGFLTTEKVSGGRNPPKHNQVKIGDMAISLTSYGFYAVHACMQEQSCIYMMVIVASDSMD